MMLMCTRAECVEYVHSMSRTCRTSVSITWVHGIISGIYRPPRRNCIIYTATTSVHIDVSTPTSAVYMFLAHVLLTLFGAGGASTSNEVHARDRKDIEALLHRNEQV